jgi:phospholipid/cholesterol/gamma-HCH transport system permease protein
MVPLPGAAGRTAAAYHAAMASTTNLQRTAGLWRVVRSWLGGWWQIIHLGAVMGVLALSPASHRRSGPTGWNPGRPGLATHLYLASGPMLPGFTVVTALISLIVIRIVAVTALSYGLTQYALEMVVRVLVLELIPLAAALFAALRATLPMAADLALLRARGQFQALVAQGRDPLVEEVLPRVLAGMFSVLLLAAVSGVLTLGLAYLSVYGFTWGGFEAYTRTVGRVFSPAVSMIFVLKVLGLSAAVSLVPLASALQVAPRRAARASVELQSLVRMFMLILLIEAASLVGNYY